MPMPTDAGSVAERLYAALEPFAYADEENDWALLVYSGAAGQMRQQIHDLVADTEDRPGWANLLDIDNCPADYLPYLAQFVGSRIPTGSSEATARDIVRTHSGFNRGTVSALEAAVAATLTDTQTVYISERVDDNAYWLTVATLTSETPDEAATLAAVLSQKPAGIKLDFFTTTSLYIDDLDGTIDGLSGTIDELI